MMPLVGEWLENKLFPTKEVSAPGISPACMHMHACHILVGFGM